MKLDEMLDEMRDVNLNYLMLAQNMIRHTGAIVGKSDFYPCLIKLSRAYFYHAAVTPLKSMN